MADDEEKFFSCEFTECGAVGWRCRSPEVPAFEGLGNTVVEAFNAALANLLEGILRGDHA